jgi:hypothetical protein
MGGIEGWAVGDGWCLVGWGVSLVMFLGCCGDLRMMQYLTNEMGDRVGVVLDLATYQALVSGGSQDPEFLVGLCESELLVLAKVSLAREVQTELSELLARQDGGGLSKAERVRLDEILEEVDRLNLLKARARYTLRSLRFEAAA